MRRARGNRQKKRMVIRWRTSRKAPSPKAGGEMAGQGNADRGGRQIGGEYPGDGEDHRGGNAAGLAQLTIFASGNLDEYEIERILARKAPIDGFGVGTRRMSADAPALDCAYKLVEYGGEGCMKLSAGKAGHPGQFAKSHAQPAGSGTGPSPRHRLCHSWRRVRIRVTWLPSQ